MFFRENEKNPAGRKRAAEAANRWRWERLYKYDKPTIAMVEGYCVGGAFMQLLGTDFAIAAEDTVFSLSSEEHTSELQSPMRIPYAVVFLTQTRVLPNST